MSLKKNLLRYCCLLSSPSFIQGPIPILLMSELDWPGSSYPLIHPLSPVNKQPYLVHPRTEVQHMAVGWPLSTNVVHRKFTKHQSPTWSSSLNLLQIPWGGMPLPLCAILLANAALSSTVLGSINGVLAREFNFRLERTEWNPEKSWRLRLRSSIWWYVRLPIPWPRVWDMPGVVDLCVLPFSTTSRHLGSTCSIQQLSMAPITLTTPHAH
jgi:hypothetical protein